MPRRVNNGFSELDFTLVKRNNKYYAHCAYCNHELSNTSFCRLKAHRSICNNIATSSQSNACSNVENADTEMQIDLSQMNVQIVDSISNISETEIQVVDITKQVNEADKENTSNNVDLIRDAYLIPITDPSTYTFTSSSTPPFLKRKKKKESLKGFLDKVSDEELNGLHTKLCSFFFGCNIPFNVIESDYFKNFIKAPGPGAENSALTVEP